MIHHYSSTLRIILLLKYIKYSIKYGVKITSRGVPKIKWFVVIMS